MRRIKSVFSVCVPILVGGTVLSLLILPGCQNPVIDEATSPQPSQTISKMRVVGDTSAFNISSDKDGPTPREDMFRLLDALDEAYERLGFQPPYPKVRIVSRKHPLLRRWSAAMAARNDQGEELVYFNRDDLIDNEALLPLVLHELSHLQAWRQHGMDIKTHGKEFMAICRAVIEKDQCRPNATPLSNLQSNR